MLRKQSDLLLGVILTLILSGLVLSSAHLPILKALVAIPVMLVVPGNALASVIFTRSNFSAVERFLFALGLSIGLLILSGLVLNLTPSGLQTRSWLLIIAMINLLTSGLAIWQRHQLPVEQSAEKRFHVTFRQATFLGLAFVIIGFSLKLSLTPQAPSNIQGYTSLWISPASEAQPDTLTVGMESQEFASTDYTLLVNYNGKFMEKWPDITLAPGRQWQQNISVPAGQGLVEALLYRTDDPGAVYRHVSIMLNR